MGAIDPQSVMALHRRTDMPVVDCKAALVEAGGDVDAAVEVLCRRCRPLGGYVAPRPGFWEQFGREPSPNAPEAEPGATAHPEAESR